MPKYDYEQTCLVECFAEKLGHGMSDSDTQILKRNTLELTKRLRHDIARRDELHRKIRIAQLEMNEHKELTLFRELEKLELKNVNT